MTTGAFAVVAVLVFVWIFYENGYLSIQSKRALFFKGRLYMAGRKGKAEVKGCTGCEKGILKVKEDGQIEFEFSSDVSLGRVWTEILDKDKNEIIRLEGTYDRKTFFAEGGKKFFVVVRFEKADGKYELKWS